MGKVTKYAMYVLFSILLAGISYSIGNVVTGTIAVIFKLNNAKTNQYIVLAIAAVFFLVAVYLLWSGKMSTESVRGVKCLKLVVIVGFGTAIVSSVLYMVVLGEIKQTMLLLALLSWVVLFAFLHLLNKIEKDLVKLEK